MVEGDPLRSVERRVRHSLRLRDWPLYRKLALAAWIPVAVLALALFTGPNRSTSAAPVATPTTLKPVIVPLGKMPGPGPAKVLTAEEKKEQAAVDAWVAAVPSRRTLVQAIGVQRFQAQRYREILSLHRTAQKAIKASKR